MYAKIVTSLLLLSLAEDYVVHRKNKTIFNAKTERIHALEEALRETLAREDYLYHLLTENRVAPTEFDLIALNNPIVVE